MSITLIGMIYRSTRYLDFMLETMRATDAELLVVANDATDEVRNRLSGQMVPWFDYHDPKPDDYYLNRVYRAWNAGAKAVNTETIVFINSDMYGANEWLPNLLKHYSKDTIPCSRLVESGKMRSGQHGISLYLGDSQDNFARDEFLQFAKDVALDEVHDGGLYMPCVFDRKEFLDAGGYPEGNLYRGGIGVVDTAFVKSGDAHFFQHTMKHRKHVTVFDSLVYHMIEGERDEVVGE